jgi:hypothetical protein
LLKYPSIAANANEWSRDSASLVEIIKEMPPSIEKTYLVQSYADALKIIWICMCALSALALIASLFTQHFSLQMELETDHGFKHGEQKEDQADQK